MHNQSTSYGTLCSLFYDATEGYASDQEVMFYASFNKQSSGRILEVMCGSGRLLIPLLQRGYKVDGVDSSKAMLNRCKERCSKKGLNPNLFEQRIEQCKLPYRYAMATIAVGSFQLISQKLQALQSLQTLHEHLAKDGVLLLDTFTPTTTVIKPTTRVARIDSCTTIRLTTRHIFDHENCKADTFCTYDKYVNGILEKSEQELVHIVWYSDEELEILLRDAGFKIIEIHEKRFNDEGLSRIVQAQKI